MMTTENSKQSTNYRKKVTAIINNCIKEFALTKKSTKLVDAVDFAEHELKEIQKLTSKIVKNLKAKKYKEESEFSISHFSKINKELLKLEEISLTNNISEEDAKKIEKALKSQLTDCSTYLSALKKSKTNSESFTL